METSNNCFLLLRIYIYIYIYLPHLFCSVNAWLILNERMKWYWSFHNTVYGYKALWIHKNSTSRKLRLMKILFSINVSTEQSQHVTVSTVQLWSCSPSAARLRRLAQYIANVHFCGIHSYLLYWKTPIISKLDFYGRVFAWCHVSSTWLLRLRDKVTFVLFDRIALL